MKLSQRGFLLNPYRFKKSNPPLNGQYLAYIIATVYPNGYTFPELYPLDTSLPTWAANFKDTSDIGLFSIVRGPAPADTGVVSKVIPSFCLTDILRITAANSNYYGDICNMQIELLSADNTVLGAVATRPATHFNHYFAYGPDLNNLTNTKRHGNYPTTQGDLTFSATGITFTAVGEYIPGYGFNESFFFACNLTNAVKLRISGRSISTYPGGGSARVLLNITRLGA